jgi:hypothetical protein
VVATCTNAHTVRRWNRLLESNSGCIFCMLSLILSCDGGVLVICVRWKGLGFESDGSDKECTYPNVLLLRSEAFTATKVDAMSIG